MSEPIVSIVMSAYNSEKYIDAAILSILDQTFGDFEFIIIDDASTDSTLDRIKLYKDPRIKILVNSANLGNTKSVNLGLRIAKGVYIARIDSDDISHPDRLKQQTMYMEQNRILALVGSNYRAISADGKESAIVSLPQNANQIRWSLYFSTPFLHSSAFFRREILSVVGYYNENYPYCQDHEYWSRIASSYNVRNLDFPLAYYRVHGASISGSKFEDQYELFYKSVKQYMRSTLTPDNIWNTVSKEQLYTAQYLLGFVDNTLEKHLHITIDNVLWVLKHLNELLADYAVQFNVSPKRLVYIKIEICKNVQKNLNPSLFAQANTRSQRILFIKKVSYFFLYFFLIGQYKLNNK